MRTQSRSPLYLADHRAGRGEGGFLAEDDGSLFVRNVPLNKSLRFDQMISLMTSHPRDYIKYEIGSDTLHLIHV